VAQRGQQPRLTAKRAPQHLVTGQGLLKGNRQPEPVVACRVDGPHTTTARERQDLVAAVDYLARARARIKRPGTAMLGSIRA